jgi:hypothetical protein
MGQKRGLAATRTRGLSQAVLGFYPKRAITLLETVKTPQDDGDTYNHTTRPQDLVVFSLKKL